MELRLDGKVALVTGASRGIGKAIAASSKSDPGTTLSTAKVYSSITMANVPIK